MTLIKYLLFFFFVIGNLHYSLAQSAYNQCATDSHRHYLSQSYPNYHQWQSLVHNESSASERTTIQIPVVVHVVYKNEDENISDTAIESQIDVLNKDFNAENVEVSQIPSIFQDVLADVDFHFCLATEDPDGLPASGIVRKQTTVNQFSDQSSAIFYDNEGGSDSWDDSRYLNIWVCNLGTFLAGFATFPGEAPSGEDGVVVSYLNFGIIDQDAPYDLGRTTTHEVGHFFGVEHLWGSGTANCSGDDGLTDTPMTGSTYIAECPTGTVSSCNTPDMYMNFMNFTNDACMAMFTQQQKNVMVNAIDLVRTGFKQGSSCSTSTDENHNFVDCFFYPNPAHSKLYFSIPPTDNSVSNLQILRANGEVIYDSILVNELNISGWANGVYFIILNNDKGTITSKCLLKY